MKLPRKLINKKILLGASSLLLCFGVVAITSFVPFIIDPSKWQTMEFLTDQLVISAIVILSMLASIFIGQTSNAQNEDSKIAKARRHFWASRERITDIIKFRQWVKQVLQPSDIKTIRENKLKEAGIEDMTVYDLSDDTLDTLLDTPRQINGHYFKSLSKKQINIVKALKAKGPQIKFVEPEYYLSADTLKDTRTISERASSEGKKKSLYLTYSVLNKVIVTIVVAMIFASLGKDLSQEDADITLAILKFLSRVWAMCTSIFMGYVVGTQINDIDAEYVNLRIDTHERFIKDTDFKGLSQQEEAKLEFESTNPIEEPDKEVLSNDNI